MALPLVIASAVGNGNTAGVECRGLITFAIYGTHGGGTSTLQYSPDDGTSWVPFAAAGVTVDASLTVDVPIGAQVRLSVTGGTANSVSCRGGQSPRIA